MARYSARQLSEAFAVARTLYDFDDDAFYRLAGRYGGSIGLLLHARTVVRAGDPQLEAEVIEGRLGIVSAIHRLRARAHPKPAARVLPFAPVLH